MIRALVLAVAILFGASAQAADQDSRIQLLAYDPDRVVDLAIGFGYAAVIELAPDEAVQNVVVGNSDVWQVTANSSSDRIIVKPLAGAAVTNMIVITDARRYLFQLQPSGGDGQSLYVLRFSYPDKAGAASDPASAAAALARYKLSGTRGLFPTAMHDDGKRTTIRWAEQAAMPAVFAVGEGGKEAIVNGRMIGGDYVIEGIAPKYMFRLGDAEAVASRKKPKASR
jgi:type IV secretion system protein VirB9